MRRTRRKRPRVAWFPTFGVAPISEFTPDPAPGVEVELNLTLLDPPEDGVVWDAFPLTFDETEDSETAQADPAKRTLRDIVQGNEWRLRRIVGKAFIHAAQGVQGATVSPALDVGLGFIVVKTYDDGAPLTDFNEVNPLSQDSMEDPWIWRRRWILHPYGTVGERGVSNPSLVDTRNTPNWWGFPSNNTCYGSATDGPHIDAKTARVIHRSERLYGVLAARRYYQGGAVELADSQVKMLLDYRLLGSLRGQAYGNRGNTSR